MNARFSIVFPCLAMLLAAIAAGSAVAVHGASSRQVDEAAPASVTAVLTPSEPTRLAPTRAPLPTSSPTMTDSSTTQSRLMPVPQNAQPSTQASELAGPGSLLRSQPTPQPHRPTVILDPGHGRGDPGAVHHTADGDVDLTEAEANLDIAENLRRFLEAKGYDVYITRSGYGKPLAVGSLTQALISGDLMSRVRLASAVDGDVFISIHNNGSPDPEASGTEIWYCGQNSFGDESAGLAKLVLDAAVQGLKDYGYDTVRRGVQEDATEHDSPGFCQFLVTREVQMPAILTETLFLTNDADAAVLKDPLAREDVADRVAQAIDTFLKERDSAN